MYNKIMTWTPSESSFIMYLDAVSWYTTLVSPMEY